MLADMDVSDEHALANFRIDFEVGSSIKNGHSLSVLKPLF
jgi:hypothetical protein